MGSIFDDRQFLHGLPLRGQKIKFVKPTKFAFHTNVIENEKLLELGKEYTVRCVSLNSSSTYVYLEEFWDEDLDGYRFNQKSFSMDAFQWEKPPLDTEKLIGRDYRDCAMIHYSRGYGVIANGKTWYEGHPNLSIMYDEVGTITHAQLLDDTVTHS